MSEIRYLIHSGGQPITDLTNYPIRDPDEIKRLARELSEKQPGTEISVVSHSLEPGGKREWNEVVAKFMAGRELPCRWRVDFYGYLDHVDHHNLSQAGIFYVEGGSEKGPQGEIRSGYARNVVTVEANSPEEAEDKVREALGPKEPETSEYHVRVD